MQRKQIIDHLSYFYAKLDQFIGKPEGLNRSFIAGGAIASLVLDQEVSDYDVWFEDADAYGECVKNVVYDRLSRFSTTITLPTGEVVQLIKNRLGKPAATVAGFDFKHTQNYFTRSGVLVCDEAYIKSKELDYNRGNLEHPVNTVQRVMKFVRRGYWVKQSTLIDLMIDIQNADRESITEDHAGSR